MQHPYLSLGSTFQDTMPKTTESSRPQLLSPLQTEFWSQYFVTNIAIKTIKQIDSSPCLHYRILARSRMLCSLQDWEMSPLRFSWLSELVAHLLDSAIIALFSEFPFILLPGSQRTWAFPNSGTDPWLSSDTTLALFFFSWIPTWVSDPYIFCVVFSYLKEKADMVSVTVFYQKGLFFNIWLGSEVRVMLINLCFIVLTQLKKCEKLILITACV